MKMNDYYYGIYYIYCFGCKSVKRVIELENDGIHRTCKEHPNGVHKIYTEKEVINYVIKLMHKEEDEKNSSWNFVPISLPTDEYGCDYIAGINPMPYVWSCPICDNVRHERIESYNKVPDNLNNRYNCGNCHVPMKIDIDKTNHSRSTAIGT